MVESGPLVTKEDIRKFLQRFQEVDHYEAIGEFIFKFSQLEYLIRYRLFKALGLKQELFDIITASYDFAMLCTVTSEVIKAKPGLTKQNLAAVDKYFNDCKGFNHKNRVVVAHATWSTSGARHVNRQTLKHAMHFADAKELKAKCEEVIKLALRINETNV